MTRLDVVPGRVAGLAASAAGVCADRRGNVIIEAALLMMPLLMMIFGFFELGRYFFVSDALADAAREGARAAIVRGATSAAPATEAEIVAMVRARAPTMIDPNRLTVSVSFSPNNSPGARVEIQVNYPIGFMLPGIGVLGPLNISKVAAMTISR